MRVHLDTNAYTAFLVGDPDAVFVVQRAPQLALSPIVVGELKAGFALGTRRRENLAALARFLASPRVTPCAIDDATTDRYARIYKQLRSDGRPIPTNDLWIAASVDEGECLFTRDRHFLSIDELAVARDQGEFLKLLRPGG